MKKIHPMRVGVALAAFVCALTVAGPDAFAQKQPTDSSTRSDNAATQQDRVAMLPGLWGDDGVCDGRTEVQFNADGTFHSFQTGGDGHWTLNGDRLTMQGSGGVFDLTLHWIDADHMNVENADGQVAQSQRC